MQQPHPTRSAEDAAAAFEELRPRLTGVAHGPLGSLAEAEDAVQEAWLRLQGSDLAAIRDLTGRLVTTTSPIALDVLRSSRSRHETYVDPWLPEPVETAPDPADTISLADSLSWAVLVVLETLSPAERAAFVLHDVSGLPFAEVGEALGRAAGSGDLDGLLELLAPDAVLTSDGGGVVRALQRPVRGAREIAAFIAGLDAAQLGLTLRPSAVNGSPALLIFERGRVTAVLALGIRDGRITTLDAVRNPQKFSGLRSQTDQREG